LKALPPLPALLGALLAALLASGCASSVWERTETVPGGKLYVPRVYAPLLPGSIYPNRKVPVKASGLPAIALVCPEKGGCRKDAILAEAAARGLVVLVGREPRIDWLRTRAEADPERIGWLLVSPTGEFLRRWSGPGAEGAAAAVLLPATRAAAPSWAPPALVAYSPSKKSLSATLLSAAPPEAGDGSVLKVYSPNEQGLLPNEAIRDAVDWLAGELGIH
jgi:hypothetical protein